MDKVWYGVTGKDMAFTHIRDLATNSSKRGLLGAFTNMVGGRRSRLICFRKFIKADYLRYSNEGDLVLRDPDCKGLRPLGVPVTFLDSHCPDQFEPWA